MTPVDGATLAYLSVTLAELSITRSHPLWPAVACFHVFVTAAVFWSCQASSKAPSWGRDWYPLLLLPLLYFEIPLFNETFLSFARDSAVMRLEGVVFPFQPARTLARAWPWRPLSEALHLAYLSYYPLIYGPLLLLYFKGRRDAFRETMFVVMLTYYVCYLVFVFFPVRGPWDLWPVSDTPPNGFFRSLAVQILQKGSSMGAAFPSSHMAVAVAQTMCAMRHSRRIALLAGALSVGIAVGAVYASFHNGIDMIAGGLLGAAVVLGTRKILASVGSIGPAYRGTIVHTGR